MRIGISDEGKKLEYTVSESEYRELGSLLSGDEVSDVSFLEDCDMRYRAKVHALRILSCGDNSVKTLKRKLMAKSISSDAADEVCREMVGLGYINESRQLEKLIENEVNVKLSGRRKLIPKLVSKGYKKEKVECVLEKLISHGIVDFDKSSRKLIDKKFPEGASEDDIRALLYKYGYSEA